MGTGKEKVMQQWQQRSERGEGVLVRENDGQLWDSNLKMFSYSISVHSDLEVAGLFKAGVRMHRWPCCGFMMKAVEGREEVRCCHALIPLFAHQSQHPGFGSAKACPDNELGLLILYSIEA